MTLTVVQGPIAIPLAASQNATVNSTNSKTQVGKASAWGGMVAGYAAVLGVQPMLHPLTFRNA